MGSFSFVREGPARFESVLPLSYDPTMKILCVGERVGRDYLRGQWLLWVRKTFVYPTQ